MPARLGPPALRPRARGWESGSAAGGGTCVGVADPRAVGVLWMHPWVTRSRHAALGGPGSVHPAWTGRRAEPCRATAPNLLDPRSTSTYRRISSGVTSAKRTPRFLPSPQQKLSSHSHRRLRRKLLLLLRQRSAPSRKMLGVRVSTTTTGAAVHSHRSAARTDRVGVCLQRQSVNVQAHQCQWAAYMGARQGMDRVSCARRHHYSCTGPGEGREPPPHRLHQHATTMTCLTLPSTHYPPHPHAMLLYAAVVVHHSGPASSGRSVAAVT